MIFKTSILLIFHYTLASGINVDKKISSDRLSALNLSHVHMKNELAVIDKINKIVSDGADKLLFITDYDQTVTKQHENGVLTKNSVGVFFQSKKLPQSSLKIIIEKLLKFEAIEFNSTIKKERKIELANDLTETVHKKLQGLEIDRREIERVVRQHGPSLRNGTHELFARLKNLSVPAVIFSAGLGDTIEAQLHQESLKHDNVLIITNHLKFNGSTLDGVRDYKNAIRSFNKHDHVGRLISSEVLKNRENVILMGDHTEDASLVRGFERGGTILKIGFFYNETEDSFNAYKDAFDIVLNDDQTMKVVLGIVSLFQ